MDQTILSKTQLSFLQKAGTNKFIKDNFYLTGGTALAAFYLHHRYSEDLDFFSENEVDLLALDVFIKGQKQGLGIQQIDFQQSNNRNLFFLNLDNEVLKAEFTYFPFPRIEKGMEMAGVQVDSLLDIAVNKLFTIYQRTKARDYIDLYLICKEKNFLIVDLIQKARLKFDWHIDPLQLGTQFIKSKEAQDHPRMIKSLPNEEWQNFFLEEAKKLEKDIID